MNAAGTRPLPGISTTPWALSKLHPELSRVGLATPLDLQLRRLGGSAMLRTFLRMHPGQPHSDFHPTVALQVPSHRFAGRNAAQLKQLVTLGLDAPVEVDTDKVEIVVPDDDAPLDDAPVQFDGESPTESSAEGSPAPPDRRDASGSVTGKGPRDEAK